MACASFSSSLARCPARSKPRPSCHVLLRARCARPTQKAAAALGMTASHDGRWRQRARRRTTVALANIIGDGARANDEEAEQEEGTKRASLQLPLTRRRVQMTFTCNICEGRTQRMINPDVLERGTMWVQCGECEAWHQIVDNLGLIFDLTGDWESDAKDIRQAMRERRKEEEG